MDKKARLVTITTTQKHELYGIEDYPDKVRYLEKAAVRPNPAQIAAERVRSEREAAPGSEPSPPSEEPGAEQPFEIDGKIYTMTQRDRDRLERYPEGSPGQRRILAALAESNASTPPGEAEEPEAEEPWYKWAWDGGETSQRRRRGRSIAPKHFTGETQTCVYPVFERGCTWLDEKEHLAALAKTGVARNDPARLGSYPARIP